MTQEEKTTLSIADVFKVLGGSFLHNQRCTPRQFQAVSNILSCRTAVKGGHLWRCESCRLVLPVYNSCLDRHCPRCQGREGYRWAEKRMAEVLNAPYFHLVFTLPHELNPLVAHNPKRLLGLLFQAVANTLLLFGRDPAYLGGELGILAILHTWDQKLNRHIHLHCIVPGGALSSEGLWVSAKRGKFMFPVHALGKTFRRLFWHGSRVLDPAKDDPVRTIKRKFKGLKALLQVGGLHLPGELARTEDVGPLKKLENRLYRHRWVVYAKRPFGGPRQVLKYLSRYTHRVAISNARILNLENRMVRFTWHDRKKNQHRTLTLKAHEFGARFLQHVLPKGFVKIRSYGFLSNRSKKSKLAQIRPQLAPVEPSDLMAGSLPDDDSAEILGNSLEEGARHCPSCGKPSLKILMEIKPARAYMPVPWDTS